MWILTWWMCCFLPLADSIFVLTPSLPLNLPYCSYLSVFLTRFTLKSFHPSLLLYFLSYHLLLSSIALLLSSCSCSLRVELVLRPPLPRLWDPPLFQLNMPGTSTWPCPMYLALLTMSRPFPHLTILNLPKRSSHTKVQMCPWRPKEKDWYWTWGRGSSPLQRPWNGHHTLSRPKTGRSLKGTIRCWWPLKTFQKQMESTSQRQPCQVEEYWWSIWLCFKCHLSS